MVGVDVDMRWFQARVEELRAKAKLELEKESKSSVFSSHQELILCVALLLAVAVA